MFGNSISQLCSEHARIRILPKAFKLELECTLETHIEIRLILQHLQTNISHSNHSLSFILIASSAGFPTLWLVSSVLSTFAGLSTIDFKDQTSQRLLGALYS
jgi:hypothetical protein